MRRAFVSTRSLVEAILLTASLSVTPGVYPMPTLAQMEAAQRDYSRRLAENQNARLAKSNAAFNREQENWTQLARTASSPAAQPRPAYDGSHVYDGLTALGHFFAACLLLGAFLGAILSRRAARRKAAPALASTSYAAATSLLTPTEVRFHAVLAEAVGPMATIQCKVRLADLLTTRRGDLAAFRRVSQKHVDFVLCDRHSLRPLVAVELDDRSHDRADRRERDAFVDAAYAQAGLPLLHVPVRSEYQPAALLAQLQPFLLS